MKENDPLIDSKESSFIPYSGGESSSFDIEDISFDSIVSYKDFSIDNALAEQSKFKNAQKVQIGRLNFDDLGAPIQNKTKRGIFSQSDSSFDSDKHQRF